MWEIVRRVDISEVRKTQDAGRQKNCEGKGGGEIRSDY